MTESERTDIGKLELTTFLDEDSNIRQEFDLAGMSMEEAVGRLTVVVDRLRDEIRDEAEGWEEVELSLTCPHCGELITSDDMEVDTDE